MIVEVDWHTGRVLRIPGVYPWTERWARWLPVALVASGVALFVLIGTATGL